MKTTEKTEKTEKITDPKQAYFNQLKGQGIIDSCQTAVRAHLLKQL